MAEETDATLINPVEATTDAEFESLWTRLLGAPGRPRAILALQERDRSGQTPPAARPPPTGNTDKRNARARARPPRVGTIVQRSSATNARKLQALLTVPPRPPPRPRATAARKPPTRDRKEVLKSLFGDIDDLSEDEAPGTTTTPPAPPSTAARAEPATPTTTGPPKIFGPVGPPPVRVTVGGTSIDVPYFSATITRKFRACIGQRKFVLRFDREGKCVFQREVSPTVAGV